MPQRVDGLGYAARLGQCGPELEVNRRRSRLLPCEWLEQCERRLQLTGEAMRRTEDEACPRVARKRPENLTGLLRGQRRALPEQSPGVGEGNINRPNRFDGPLATHAAQCTMGTRGSGPRRGSWMFGCRQAQRSITAVSGLPVQDQQRCRAASTRAGRGGGS